MFAQAAKRTNAHLRLLALRHSPQLLRPFHLPPSSSPLLHSFDPRTRRLLFPVLARASGTFALQTRGLQASALPKVFLKAFRVPAGGLAFVTAGFAYVNYKVQEVGNWSKDKLEKAEEWLTGTWDSTRSTVGDVSEGVFGVASQIRDGWNNTVEGLELPKFETPAWLENMMKPSESKHENRSSSPPPPGPPKADPVAVGAAVAAGVYALDDEKERKLSQAKDDQIMLLTRKMIEIRSLLQKIGQNDDFKLPSIVVIGSQSSGKSSVLESIVGHEFLPKGSNMVTRRPIELTLINTPDSAAEFAEFPALKLGKITDFGFVQKTLTELNLAVPAHECVSDDPIQLNIYSPSIPNLTLIDLPGYIQIHDKDQPDTLKEKILQLCDKYISDTNVILAISAADVDLANSTALRASRRVDPKGLRTIGVITKMDLVTPEHGRAILLNNRYPLRLGYIGVVCRAPSSATGLFARGSSSANLTQVARHEQAYFTAHPEFNPAEGIQVGTAQLKKTLQLVLEKSMSQSLEGAARAIRRDLDETSYRFKVEYNDRGLTAETYLAESADALKAQFAVLETKFNKRYLHDLVKAQLDDKVLDLCAERYWMDERIMDLPTAQRDDSYWRRKLDATSGTLTRVGVGRISTEVVERALQTEVNRIVAEGTLKHSPFAQSRINDAVQEIITSRKGKTIDQVENCVKPYKYGVDVDDREWETARERQARNLERELKMCEESYSNLQKEVGGRRRLGQVIQAVKSADTGGAGGGFSEDLLMAGRRAIFLRDRANLLNFRIRSTKSKQCAIKENASICPEVFLDAVSEKLASMAVLFLDVELISEFHYQFPRELDNRLLHSLSPDEVARLAKEDPKVRDHIELMERKNVLEYALQKIEDLKSLEATKENTSVLRSPRRLF